MGEILAQWSSITRLGLIYVTGLYWTIFHDRVLYVIKDSMNDSIFKLLYYDD